MKNNTRKKLRVLTVMMMSMLMMFANVGYISANSLNAKSSSAILMDADTGQILFEKNAYNQRQIASLSKVMTALVSLEEGNIDAQVYIGSDSAKIKGTSFKLKDGMIMSKRDLLYGLLYISGNDAGDALARGSVSGYDGFIGKMNQRAQQLGMFSTRFYDPHGLGSYAVSGAGNNYSTAYDLAILMKEAMKNQEFVNIQKTGSVATGNWNYPTLSNGNIYMKVYQGATGAKTGYTGNAGNCQMAAAYRNGKNLIAVVLNAPKGTRDNEIYALMDYGFGGGYVAPSKEVIPVMNTELIDIAKVATTSADGIVQDLIK